MPNFVYSIRFFLKHLGGLDYNKHWRQSQKELLADKCRLCIWRSWSEGSQFIQFWLLLQLWTLYRIYRTEKSWRLHSHIHLTLLSFTISVLPEEILEGWRSAPATQQVTMFSFSFPHGGAERFLALDLWDSKPFSPQALHTQSAHTQAKTSTHTK